jgi:hypothetical protein
VVDAARRTSPSNEKVKLVPFSDNRLTARCIDELAKLASSSTLQAVAHDFSPQVRGRRRHQGLIGWKSFLLPRFTVQTLVASHFCFFPKPRKEQKILAVKEKTHCDSDL